MPLQLLFIFIFILLFLPPVFSTGPVAKPGCQASCGNLTIPHPFGIGLDCSFDPWFAVSCDTSTDHRKAYLSVLNKEVIEINETYIRVKYPNLVSACYGMSGESYKNSSMSLNLSGTPYTVSDWNRLTAIGCDDMMMQSNGSWVSGGCSAFCADKNDSGGVGYCAKNSSLLGNGCCQAFINGDGITSFLGAELSDMSGNFKRRKLFPCSYAFIQEYSSYQYETVFSYPLYYLDNSTAFENDYWASATMAPVVRLDWAIIAAENCSRAKQNSSTYACKDNRSVCVDANDEYIGHEIVRGYVCRCVPGYEGNPYLLGGCQAISFSSSIAKPGCPDQCGEISIPFPFGVGQNCYREPSFEIICNASTNPPIAYLAILKAKIIELKNSSQVLVNNPYSMGLACYNLSDYQHGMITKTKERSLAIDLSKTQYTLSEENWITAIGCDDMVVGIVGQANRRFFGSSCSSVCWEGETEPTNYGRCPYASDSYYDPGRGCCNAAIPRGTAYLEINLSDLSGQWKRSKFYSCSYVFVSYNDDNGGSSSFFLNDLNNSTAMQTDIWPGINSEKLMLDWRIGQGNCDEARQNLTNFACHDNSDCVNFDTEVGGYLCNCSKGYQGNPYIASGCQDIDECADNTTNPCALNSTCNNTPGSVYCSCLKGYYGDGRKDGTGCILHEPQPKTKIIIIIGIGSGLGFQLFVLMIFWLYKVLQKRKNRKRKEDLFKHLLFQQQTNEDTFRKTKLFSAKELEKATDNFNESRICGKGGQGIVYKGMLSDGMIVAIKKLKKVDENQVEQFINEVVILSQINHRNVVKLLGCCLATEVPLLVYEFLPNGTLFDLLRYPNLEFPLTWNMRLKIAADVAGAIAYLHSASSVPIYHRDVKSTNVLLDEKNIVKVSDFGTSKFVEVDQTHLTTLVKGTIGYLDPEYFQTSRYTEKSDVYSFGVVLVELLTGQRPISLQRSEDHQNLGTLFLASMEENNLDAILDSQVSKQAAKEEVMAVAKLARRCLNLSGKMRPTMKEVAIELESLMIYQIPSVVNDEPDEAIRVYEAKSRMISDIEYARTISDQIATTSSFDAHHLMHVYRSMNHTV